jgi:pimeloyl-ACP methyl ester carboxylesterase
MLRFLALAALLLVSACASAPQPLAGGSTIHTRGGDIYVKEWGDPRGRPVVMIHGTTSHLEEFVVSLGPTLQSDFRLIAYDRPGMGRSTRRPHDADQLVVQAQTASDIIAALNLQRPVVVGHSYGGAVALRLALDHPDQVSGLVLLSPASHPWDGGVPPFYTLQAAPVLGEIATTLTWPISRRAATISFNRRVFAPQPAPPTYYDEAEVRLAMRPAQVRASSRDFVSLPAELRAQAPRYPELRLPISIIAGEDDRIVPIAAMARQNPAPPFVNSHLILLPGVGHMPQHARPDLVKSEIEWAFAQAAR